MSEKDRVHLVLIDPFCLGNKKTSFKLGLGYLASYVSKFGYKTLIIKYQSFKEIEHIIRTKDPKVVGITGITYEFPRVMQIAERIKRIKKDIVIIFGGPHASFCQSDYKKIFENIDIIVKNEGEYTLKELLDYAYGKPKGKNLHHIKGIVFSEKNKIIETENRPFIKNLDNLPFPVRDYDAEVQEIMCLRGCYFKCKFCLWYKCLGSTIRYRSPENIVKEIETILSKNPKSKFYFVDSTLTISENYLQEICNMMIKRKIIFTNITQIYGSISNLSSKLLNLLKKVGIQYVFFGVENGSPSIREMCGKKFSNEDVIDCFSKVSTHNLLPVAGFCLGLPSESKESILESLRLALKLNSDVRNLSFLILSFKPYPGTEFYENPKNYDYTIIEENYTRWSEQYVVGRTSEINEKNLASYIWSFCVIFNVLRVNFHDNKIIKILYWPIRIILKMCPYLVFKYFFFFLVKSHGTIKNIFGIPDNAIHLIRTSKSYLNTAEMILS